MEQRQLGRTGLQVSALGYGCGAIGGLMVKGEPAEQTRAVARALEAGITYFDTAPVYGNGRSEENIGRCLTELGAWDRVVLGTKVRLAMADLEAPRAAVRRSAEASLKRLGRESVDLLQLHNRIDLFASELAGDARLGLADAIGEVAEGLKDVRKAGLARHIGFTGLGETAALLETAMANDYDTVQAYFNVLNPSAGFPGDFGNEQDFDELIDTANRAGLGVIAIRVLAAGALIGTMERHPNASDPGQPLVRGAEYAKNVERAQRLGPIAAELGYENTLELALRFALAKEGISTVLVGLAEYSHLESALHWAEKGPLSAEVVERLVELEATDEDLSS
jgi:aryl-alcohol dehydrogenase-like predicted oxidoreductase